MMFKSFLYLSQVNKCQIEIPSQNKACIDSENFSREMGGVLISDRFLSLLGGGGAYLR